MSLVSKTGTYNETAFDKPWWKSDFRLGFDPPEDAEGIRREKEWQKQFQRQKQQMKGDWENYMNDPANAQNLPSQKQKEKEEKEKEDRNKRLVAGGGGGGVGAGIGNMLTSAIKPNYKKLVRHGIPSELRAAIWFEKSGARKKKQDNPGVYAKYVAEINQDSHVMEEIQMDIARTFTMHLMFANQLTKRMMLRILSAFTVRNPNYGYCQNMTFIVGIILFFLPEEDAFWLFTTVMEDILFVDFCSPTMIGLRVDQKVLETLIKERLPKLYAHFSRFSIDASVFTTSWLLRLFVNVFPIETTLRIWDCFLFEGSKILFRVALAYLKLHEEQMKQCTDSGEVMTFLSSECKMFYDADRLIKACASFWALRRKQINELRARYIQELGDPTHSSSELSNSTGLADFATNDSNGSESSDDGYDSAAKKSGNERQRANTTNTPTPEVRKEDIKNKPRSSTSTSNSASSSATNTPVMTRNGNRDSNSWYNEDAEDNLC